MRRPSLFLPALIGPLGLIAIGHNQPAAKEMAPTASGQRFVGSWRLIVSPDQGTPTPTLATVSADGTLVSSSLPVEAALGSPDAVIFVSSTHGAWEATGPETAGCTFVGLAADGQGRQFGSATINSSVKLGPDGQTFARLYHAKVADPDGTVVATEDGTVQATRIAVEAH
jgi:hypothetical protein